MRAPFITTLLMPTSEPSPMAQAVQHHLVADAHAAPERHRKAGIDVQHRAVLDVAALADAHLVVVGADDALEPDVDVVLEHDAAHEGRVVRDEVVRAAQLGPALADGEKRHGAMIIE
jgi:hypothetical protein